MEPKGAIGFSLYSTACRDVGGVDDMSVRDRYSFPQRQTEIPTGLFSEVVGIVILCVFVVDLDLIVEQDDLVHEGVDERLRFRLLKPLLQQPRLIPQPPTLRGSHSVALLEDPIKGGIVTESAGCGRIFCAGSGQKQITGSIQSDVQDVVPQGNAHAGLKEGVCVNGAVMEYLIYKGKIPDLGVVP